MNSIGNDIVDLKFIDKARTLSFPFYSRILSVKEQQQYQISFDNIIAFEHYVWLLWSCKESVYKLLKRHKPELVFSPVKIELLPEYASKDLQKTQIELKFAHKGKLYHTVSLITENYIATFANDTPDFSIFISDVIRIDHTEYEHQSAEVRKHLLKKLIALYPYRDFEIIKSEVGYPVVINNGINSGILASFAHHGYYVGYAFKLLQSSNRSAPAE